MSRKAASARRRTAVLAAALACFQAKGVRATTINDVRRQAGVSVGSIYHHFAGKAQLARTAYVEGLRAYQSSLLQDLAHYRGARAGIEGIIGFDLGRLADEAVWSRHAFPMHELTLDPAPEELIAALQRAFAADLAIWLAPYIDDGTLAPLHTPFFLAILFGPVHEFAEAWLGGHRALTLADAQRVLGAAAWAALRRAPAA